MAKIPLWSHTKREKLGTVDGINLFFGALLGANLGTAGAMPLIDYMLFIVLLVGLVMAIRFASVTERRVHALVTFVLYAALIGAMLYLPVLRIDGLSDGDRARLAATLAIWVGAILLAEFYPVREGEDQAEI